MSSKSKQKTKQLRVPRPLEEVARECAEKWQAAGQLQYQIVIYQKELNALNDYIERLNNEAAARKRLDMMDAQAKNAVVQQENQAAQGQTLQAQTIHEERASGAV